MSVSGGQSERELNAVRRAIEQFMPGYRNVRVQRSPLRMMIEKDGEQFSIEQLSDGEKIYIALIGDLCRRLVLANPTLQDPLQGEGIVLIDEIDLHLHPKWQTNIATQLTLVFPNIQFVITTHSPLVLTNVPTRSVRILNSNNSVISHNSIYGQPLSIILKDIMGLPNLLPEKVEALIDKVAKNIDNGDYDAAQKGYEALQTLTPNHPELTRLNFFIKRLIQ